MQTTQKRKRSLGEQIVRGLSVGCGFLMLFWLYLWLTFRPRHPVEIDKLYEATGEVLFISGLLLFAASLPIFSSRPKLAAFGVIVAVLTILAALFSPVNFVRA
jgi:hypothetical protein